MGNNNIDPKQLESLIGTVANKLNLDPNQIKTSLSNGQLDQITKNLKQSDLNKFQQALNNPILAQQILNSKQAQDLLKNIKK